MSHRPPIAMETEGGMKPVSRAEWLHLRAYFRERDGKGAARESSAGRRHRNRHRIGRPPKPKDQRGRDWKVRLSFSERQIWKRLAKEAGMSPAEWLKMQLRSAA